MNKKKRKGKKRTARIRRIPRELMPMTAAAVDLNEGIDPDRLMTAMTGAAIGPVLDAGLNHEQRAFVLSLATLVAAKFIFKSPAYATDRFQPGVAERLDMLSDELAARDVEIITGAYRPVGWQRYGERMHLHLVRERSIADRWSPAEVKMDGPSPVPTGKPLSSLRQVTEDAANAVVGILIAFREAATTRGTTEQQTHLTIAEPVALLALAKFHLAMWGNDEKAAALEYLAEQHAAQLMRDLATPESEQS